MKKLNALVAVIVAIALLLLIIAVISTFIKDDGIEKPADPTPTATPTVVPETPDAIESPDTPEPDDEPEPSSEPTPEIPPDGDPTPLSGQRFTLQAFVGQEKLSITIDTDRYTREVMEDGELYYLSSDQSRGVFIEIVFYDDDLSLREPSFLEGYVPDFTEMDLKGDIFIASSMVASRGISTTNGSFYADAWLVEVQGGFFAVVAGYSDDTQKADLYRMLDTMKFEL